VQDLLGKYFSSRHYVYVGSARKGSQDALRATGVWLKIGRAGCTGTWTTCSFIAWWSGREMRRCQEKRVRGVSVYRIEKGVSVPVPRFGPPTAGGLQSTFIVKQIRHS